MDVKWLKKKRFGKTDLGDQRALSCKKVASGDKTWQHRLRSDDKNLRFSRLKLMLLGVIGWGGMLSMGAFVMRRSSVRSRLQVLVLLDLRQIRSLKSNDIKKVVGESDPFLQLCNVFIPLFVVI